MSCLESTCPLFLPRALALAHPVPYAGSTDTIIKFAIASVPENEPVNIQSVYNLIEGTFSLCDDEAAYRYLRSAGLRDIGKEQFAKWKPPAAPRHGATITFKLPGNRKAAVAALFGQLCRVFGTAWMTSIASVRYLSEPRPHMFVNFVPDSTGEHSAGYMYAHRDQFDVSMSYKRRACRGTRTPQILVARAIGVSTGEGGKIK